MKHPRRLSLLTLLFYTGFALILGRLFWWQVIQSDVLQAVASNQYQKKLIISGQRGKIYTKEGKLLAGNEEVYRLFVEPHLLELTPAEIAEQVVSQLDTDLLEITGASSSAEASTSAQLQDNTQQLEQLKSDEIERLTQRLAAKVDSSWVGLYGKVSQSAKAKLEKLSIAGLGFEPYFVRMYPEASMAAHVTGFVGKNEDGEDLGYFGIEGALEKELQPRSSVERWERGLLGFLRAENQDITSHDGRDVYLTIRRDVQYRVEDLLAKGIERYGAKAGEVIVLDPKTGFVIASASFPSYDQKKFYQFDQELYKNPTVSSLFEPGSTFKTITVAAGIENGAISPSTVCTRCSGPVQLGKYSIKTWNNQYNPDITMTDALAKSDNVAMVFAEEQMGSEAFVHSLRQFGFGQTTTNDLQEDIVTPFPQKLGPIELATISFGQGISTTSLQLTKAVAAIANGGQLMQPQFISKVVDHTTGEEIMTKPKLLGQPISSLTAEQVTKMMVNAAEHGEAQWTASSNHTVAGKTGTAQIAVNGSYDSSKTIASFIGFSPAQNPKYVMLVKIVEPQSSPWAAETAAPLWYRISEELNLLLQIPPDK